MDDILDLVVGRGARAFAAGVRAADQTNSAALKLRLLIERAEKAHDLYEKGWFAEAHDELRKAIEEAKRFRKAIEEAKR